MRSQSVHSLFEAQASSRTSWHLVYPLCVFLEEMKAEHKVGTSALHKIGSPSDLANRYNLQISFDILERLRKIPIALHTTSKCCRLALGWADLGQLALDASNEALPGEKPQPSEDI